MANGHTALFKTMVPWHWPLSTVLVQKLREQYCTQTPHLWDEHVVWCKAACETYCDSFSIKDVNREVGFWVQGRLR